MSLAEVPLEHKDIKPNLTVVKKTEFRGVRFIIAEVQNYTDPVPLIYTSSTFQGVHEDHLTFEQIAERYPNRAREIPGRRFNSFIP